MQRLERALVNNKHVDLRRVEEEVVWDGQKLVQGEQPVLIVMMQTISLLTMKYQTISYPLSFE